MYQSQRLTYLQSLHDAAMRAEKVTEDESAALIARKGTEHELAYLQRLRAEGRQVVDIANSHKAINHLLAEVMKVVKQQGLDLHAVKKYTAGNPATEFDYPVGGVDNVANNDDVSASATQLVAGTAWLFADTRADQQFDVLFVDEAGQVALANLIAAGTAARNIVLLGDQMQLSQPVQGVHPGRSGDSALDRQGWARAWHGSGEHPRGGALQRAGQHAPARVTSRRTGGHGRQVPGPGSRAGHRVDDEIGRAHV